MLIRHPPRLNVPVEDPRLPKVSGTPGYDLSYQAESILEYKHNTYTLCFIPTWSAMYSKTEVDIGQPRVFAQDQHSILSQRKRTHSSGVGNLGWFCVHTRSMPGTTAGATCSLALRPSRLVSGQSHSIS